MAPNQIFPGNKEWVSSIWVPKKYLGPLPHANLPSSRLPAAMPPARRRESRHARVAAFYDRRPTQAQRRPGHNVRRLNNFVKTCLIKEATAGLGDQLDVACWACGVGGDGGKYAFVPAIRHVSFVDISEESVKAAKMRVGANRRVRYAHDFTVHDLSTRFEAGRQYDVIFVQFAVHYMFGSDDDLTTFCDNVVRHLKPGGRFVCTTADERRIDEARPGFDNALMRLEFDDDDTERYHFTLRGAVERVPEYVVRAARFEAAMRKAGATSRGKRGFEQLREDLTRRHPEVAERMLRGVRLSRVEKPVFRLYAAYEFRRD